MIVRLTLFAVLWLVPIYAQADKNLADLLDREWEWTLKDSPETASQLGDKRYNKQWDDVSLEAFERRNLHHQNVLKQLEAIPRNELTPENQLNYDLYRRHLEMDTSGYPFGWYLVPIDIRQGIQIADQLGSQLEFSTVQDYEDWLARLESLPTAVDQTIELMREGIRRGMVQPKVIMERVPGQISHQIVDDPSESAFYKPFREMPESIAPKQQERLRERARAAVSNQVVPAYRRLLTFFKKEYLPAAPDKAGLSNWPDGQRHYAYRARLFTTTDYTPRQIHEIGLREVVRIRAEMEKVIAEIGWTKGFAPSWSTCERRPSSTTKIASSYCRHTGRSPSRWIRSCQYCSDGYRGFRMESIQFRRLSRRIPPRLTISHPRRTDAGRDFTL